MNATKAHQFNRPQRLAIRRAKQLALGALTHPAAPLPDESDDDKRQNRNARKRRRKARR